MAEEAIPGPSVSKKLRLRSSKPLNEEEMLQMAYFSDFSDDELFEDSDSEWSGAESGTDGSDEAAVSPEIEASTAENDTIIEGPHDILNNMKNCIWETTPNLKNIQFSGRQELKVPVPGQGRPIDFFHLLFDEEFFIMLVRETNAYAEEVLLHENTGLHSRISRWKPVTQEELYIFLGIFFYTGVVQLPRIRDYWSTNRLFNLSVRNFMSRDRYLIILRCLHFVENPRDSGDVLSDRLFKIRPVMDYFNNKMFNIYSPGRNLSLDESMHLWRGRLVFRQYIKNKKHKYGIKFYLITESTGTILKMQIYTGAFDDLGGKGHAEKVVLSLVENYCSKGYSIYMDNYYNSVALATKLLDRDIYCTGTLRVGRKDTPTEVSKAKLEKGNCVYRYGGYVCVGKWKDKRDVLFITTEHQCQLEEVRSNSGTTMIKPVPVAKYNQYMSGIDLQDQMLAYYPSNRKTIRWYKKVGLHICDMMVYNAFKLYNQYSEPKISLYDFRLSVIEALLPDDKSKKNTAFDKQTERVHHTPVKYEAEGSKKKLRKRCRWCFKRGIRKDTVFICKACPDLPGLCLDPCFQEFHYNKKGTD